MPKAEVGDYVRLIDGSKFQVVNVVYDGCADYNYFLEDGCVLGNSDFTIFDVLLESEVNYCE